MSVKHKISGFFTAVILAIVSFFVLYLFFPEYSEKFLGTSIKSDKKAQATVKETKTELSSVKDRLGDLFK